jgi:ketosteroid isomerase-like protein
MGNSLKPVDVARRAYDALLAKNMDGVLANMSDDIVIHIPGSRPLAGEFRGHEGTMEFTKASRAATDDGEHITVTEILGEVAIKAARGGTKLDDPTIHFLRIVDGKIAEFWLYPWDLESTDAFWSEAPK